MNNVCEQELIVKDSDSKKTKSSSFKLFPLHVPKCPKFESRASGDTAKTTIASNDPTHIDEITNETCGTTAGDKNADSPPEREVWARKTEFLLAIIGFSVDLGNIWRCKTPFILLFNYYSS